MWVTDWNEDEKGCAFVASSLSYFDVFEYFKLKKSALFVACTQSHNDAFVCFVFVCFNSERTVKFIAALSWRFLAC